MAARALGRSYRSRSDGSRLVPVPRRVAELADRQHGVLSRDQLRSAGFSKDHLRAAVHARRWQAFGRRVVVLHNAALTGRQREWVAVLLAGKPAALAGLTAAAAAGLAGFTSDRVHILVAGDANAGWPAWVQVHNSRRFSARDIQARASPPRTRIARAVIDAAAWSARARRACALGTVLAVEIDGSVHLAPLTWWDDMDRQNELTITRHATLRFPSMAIRLTPDLIVDRLRRIRQAHG